jgi:tetratricopeptide (TPR) repeat protein
MDQSEDQAAESAIVSAAKRFGTSEFVQWAAGTFFFKKKNFPVALRYFRAAVKSDAQSARAHFGLAQSMFESGQEKESLPHFVFACKTDPATIDIFLSEGGKLKQKGNTALGEKFVQAAYACRG